MNVARKENGDRGILVAIVASKIRLKPYPWYAQRHVLLAVCTLFLPTAAVCQAAQLDNSCSVAERIFAKVEVRLEKKDDRAASALLRGLAPCPNLSPVQRFNVGWLYGKAHDFTSALRIFASLPAGVPDRLTHAYAISLGQFELGHYQDAIDTLTALRATGTFDAKCADLLGVSYSKLDQYQSAYEVMVQNLEQFPSDPYPYFNLMTLFVDTGELDKAAQVADRAVASLPQSAEIFTMRGSIELSQGEAENAYRDFASAAQLSPKSADPPFFMALSDYRLSKFAEAVQVLRNAIISGIVDSDLHYLLAECLIRVNDPDSETVLSELNQAIQLNPKSASARALRGQRLLELGHPLEAMVDLKIARHSEPDSGRDTRNATYLLARAYLALGRRDEAKALFDQVGSQFSPASAEALNQLSNQKMRIALHP
jgi:tetratricopeptide (TPR) repeat protein